MFYNYTGIFDEENHEVFFTFEDDNQIQWEFTVSYSDIKNIISGDIKYLEMEQR